MRLSRKCQRMLLAWSVECIPYPPFVLSILYGRGLCCGLRRKNLGKFALNRQFCLRGENSCAILASGTVTHDALPEAFGDDEIGNGFTGLNGQHRQSLSSPPAMKQTAWAKWFAALAMEGCLDASRPDICNKYGPLSSGNVTPPLCSIVLWLKIEIILNLAWSQVQDIFP